MGTSENLPENHVTVIGAGIVGVATALSLRLAGVPVRLIDRAPPGSGCSSGNAGMLGSNSCVPVAMPGVLRRIPKMMRAPDAPIGIRFGELPMVLPWLWRFVAASRPARVEAIARALNSLQRELMPAYQTLLAAADARDLVRPSGKLHVCESAETFAGIAYGLELQRRNGVAFEVIGPDEVRQLAPCLTPEVTRGVFYPNIYHSVNPQRMVERLAESFATRGGEIVADEIRDIEIGAEGPTALIGAQRRYGLGRVVIAAGLWSRALARRLGSAVPLISHRGYHAMLPQPADALRLPVKSEDRSIILTPMEHGLRITGVAEIAPPDLPPTPARGAGILSAGRKVMPGLVEPPTSTWMGNRPCTPDSLPVIGRSPRHASAYFAFGHGHLGLGLGAITGRVVSELMVEGRSSIDLTPFRPERF